MSVVRIDAIEVPDGEGPELEARFAARVGGVEQMPGFEEFMLLRPLAGDDRCFVVTRWESEDAYQNWRTSQQFQHQHASTHTDGGRGEAKPDHPVATGASLLEFEVVLLAPMSRCAHLAVGSRRCGTDRPEIRGDLGR